MIELKNITRIYSTGGAEVRALDGIDMTIENGEFVAVMGSSGSGKSTTMNILGCLDAPSSGSYLFEGLEVTSLSRSQKARLRRRYLGFVFQGFNLLSRTTALENVELPLVYRGLGKKERRNMAYAALDKVGLADRAMHTTTEMSGGQQQRVAIARAIVCNPFLLLADEPTGNLDSARSNEIMQLLTSLQAEHGITVVMVTHEPEMALWASRTIEFRDGKIIKEGH
ncbi:ABC transporter ATP-binding protein [Maridesulfovibrio salexigens]|uniref:ABC transporter related n=1 Tax=Maridesulfovibrio salexigens (strain ATCC 14822 / DSM 2638 / NCIMB 8403 / VKM B-1763) TaxID=526222 RepID=C6C290_MARSD|nr:ABC transporter ATP-binding protein [Maridesulfovibrio salexigens]ACS81291.1 ABC transporter related [Maridesulfovibrio salexigens DSM 2638]